jgi:hypothetical protein
VNESSPADSIRSEGSEELGGFGLGSVRERTRRVTSILTFEASVLLPPETLQRRRGRSAIPSDGLSHRSSGSPDECGKARC